MDDAYFVFGRGSRGCIGKGLGLMVIEQTVAAVSVLLQCFSIIHVFLTRLLDATSMAHTL